MLTAVVTSKKLYPSEKKIKLERCHFYSYLHDALKLQSWVHFFRFDIGLDKD